MYRVVSFNFWEDRILNVMGIHTTYGKALEQAKEIAKQFNNDKEIEVSEYSTNEVMVKGFDVDRGALIQMSQKEIVRG